MQLSRLILKLVLPLSAAVALFVAPVRATTFNLSDGTPGSFFSSDWNQGVVAQVTLPSLTSSLTALSSTAVAYDQGWGGYDPNGNQVYIGLFEDATLLTWVHVAGGVRDGFVANQYDPQNFTASASELAAFDVALATINWGLNPTVTLQMATSAFGWPGWELTVNNASFSVSGNAGSVPDASNTLALFGLALAGLVALNRKQTRKI